MSQPRGGDGGPPAAGGRGVISVRTELVGEYVIDRVLEETLRRHPGELPGAIAEAIGRTLDAVPEAPAEAAPLAEALARAGYLTRVVEAEMFEPARAPNPWLTEALADRLAASGESPAEAVESLSRELAVLEPPGRPDPGDQRAVTWRVGGPGGHVRHYLAGRAVGALAPRDTGDRPRLPEGFSDPGLLKRCWLYGFFLRCCEEWVRAEASGE